MTHPDTPMTYCSLMTHSDWCVTYWSMPEQNHSRHTQTHQWLTAHSWHTRTDVWLTDQCWSRTTHDTPRHEPSATWANCEVALLESVQSSCLDCQTLPSTTTISSTCSRHFTDKTTNSHSAWSESVADWGGITLGQLSIIQRVYS